ncbi:UNVERIFIED_CONTAM: MAPEG family protein, partial [Bacteroidetes bacterium 56_B9]
GFENLGLFAAAVVAGNIVRLDNWTLNVLSGGYLLSRVAYNLIYINNTTDAMGESGPSGLAFDSTLTEKQPTPAVWHT